MENGKILASQIHVSVDQSSSIFGTSGVETMRLNSTTAWCISAVNLINQQNVLSSQLITVDLKGIHYISAITIEGAHPNSGYITGFRVLISIDQFKWYYVKENGTIKVRTTKLLLNYSIELECHWFPFD